jgi:hypothetical protein
MTTNLLIGTAPSDDYPGLLNISVQIVQDGGSIVVYQGRHIMARPDVGGAELPAIQPMTAERAHDILNDGAAYIRFDADSVLLDGYFSLDELQAVITLFHKDPK